MPDGVTRLLPRGVRVVVEEGAGLAALQPDDAYRDAGATVVSTADLKSQADITLRVGRPELGDLEGLRPGHVIIGLLDPLNHPALAKRLADLKVTALSL